MREELEAAEELLAQAVEQRERWERIVARMREQGRRPSTRTLHNLQQRASDVITLASRLHTLKTEQRRINDSYKTITRRFNEVRPFGAQ
ncbi:MAG: hypothetical protein AAFX65_10570 [Cyanobacteria bacterium J06638_7]